MSFSTYEHDEARKIIAYRYDEANKPTSKLGGAITRGAQQALDKAHDLPGADKVFALATSAYDQAVKGIGKALTRSAGFTLRRKAHWRRYARRGHEVTSWSDIRSLDLEVIDEVRPHSLSHRYAIGAGLEGAVGGLLMGGGAIVAAGGAIAGAGAGAAPGAGIAASVFATDTATTLVSSTRLTLQIGSFHGYDPTDELEQLFAGSVLNLGTAGTVAAKNAAFVDLFRLTKMLATNKAWVDLNKAALTVLLRPMFAALSVRLVKMKLGQAVPIAGVAVGFGMNYALLDRIGTTAHWAYRERFLRDKGYPFPEVVHATHDPDDDGGDEEISIVTIAADEALDLPPT